VILSAGDEKFEFSPDDILNVEAIAVKKKIGMDVQQWMEAVSKFDAEAVTALIWVAKKRTQPTLRYEDVSFPLSSLGFELTDEEKAKVENAGAPKVEDAPTENS
jgi:hypothetical protein